ncbi:hypothetical protein TURU_051346 [Turdus rufiventris]|nr:hypothetical protein TURU_051346 [Turdus rufiventris]
MNKHVEKNEGWSFSFLGPGADGQVWSAVNAICVTEEMEYSPEVEWENPPTDMHYYKLKFRSVLEIDEKQVMVAKSNDPKSRYILSGLKPGTEHEVITVKAQRGTILSGWQDWYMGRYTSADGVTKEIQVGSENDMITLLDLKPDMEYVTDIWAEEGPRGGVSSGSMLAAESAAGLENFYCDSGVAGLPLTQKSLSILLAGAIAQGFFPVYRRLLIEIDPPKNLHVDSGHTADTQDGGKYQTFTIPSSLDKMHDLTSSSSIFYELHVDLWTASKSVCAVYDF